MQENTFPWLSRVSACLISSSPLQGKHTFINSLIFSFAKQAKPVLYITTDHTPEDTKRAWLSSQLFYGEYEKNANLKFIDCYSMNAGNQPKNSSSIVYVPGPLALNELSVAIAETEAEFFKKSSEHLIIFDSLSTMLLYMNPATVARFMQVIIGKIKNANGKVCFAIEEGMHSKEIMVTIEHLMDAIVYVKRDNGKVFYRADGIPELQEWQALE